MFTTMQPRYSEWIDHPVHDKVLILGKNQARVESHIESSKSLCQIETSGWMGLVLWLSDITIWLIKYQFLLKSFLILRKKP